MNSEYDLSGFICPLSLVKAVTVIDNLGDGEVVKLILGDSDSLKSVVGELKVRNINQKEN